MQPDGATELVYQACSTKRARRSKAEIRRIKAQIYVILRNENPMTVRQVFYQMVVRGIIEKSEAEYQGTVIRLLTEMRLKGEVPFCWIVDESRRTRQTRTFDSVADALEHTAKYYRRSALQQSLDYVEIWSEKEALAGIIWDVASEYDVPVVVSKGMPSLTQVYQSFECIRDANNAGKSSYIYQFGDHDPSGVWIPKTIETRLGELCGAENCAPPVVERVALTEEQIAEYRLPTRPTEREGNRHAKTFEGESTELDALPPTILRQMVREVIECHISEEQLDALRAAEESERQLIEAWADRIGDMNNADPAAGAA